MTVLGIETSCDECSAAVVVDAKEVLSNVIATQIELHKPYQGVVPELASRLHTEWIEQVVDAAISKAGITKEDLDAVAFTNRPGLLGSLLVGVNFAKCFASTLDIPFIAIDHIRAHLYASQHLSILMQNTETQQYLKIFSNHSSRRGDHASSGRPAEGFPDLFMILLKNMSKSSPSGLCI